MLAYIAGRLGRTLLILLAMTVVTFALTQAVPGDPARLAAGTNAGEEQIENVREELGLDEPVPVQYAIYVRNLVQLDLGTSFHTRDPVAEDLVRFAPATLELVLLALLVTAPLGIAIGVWSANRAGGHRDRTIAVGSSASGAIPVFWLALLLQLVFFYWLGWLPAEGRAALEIDPPRVTGFLLLDSLLTWRWDVFVSGAEHLVLPVGALVLTHVGIIVRVSRRSVLTELGRQYALVARSKGLRRRDVMRRHVLRNALNPVITILGIQFGYLMMGAVLVEAIFGFPGLGLYAVDSTKSLDYPAIIGVTLFVTAAFAIANLIVDVAYVILDPRVREA